MATLTRDGVVVKEGKRSLYEDGPSVARRFIQEMGDDVEASPQGPDTPGRLTAAGEAMELVLDDRAESESFYRRALRADGRSSQAHESLRRLHRAAGNWRVVAQLLDQEIAQTLDEARRAQLTLAMEMLVRTRPEAAQGPRWAEPVFDDGLPSVYKRVQVMLDASRALADRKVEGALAIRARLVAPRPEGESAATGQEWSWSEANLRRLLLRDTRKALDLMLGLFDAGQREPELLGALVELLSEHREWDRLRRVLALVVDGEGARPEQFEALASLLEVRFRDMVGAAGVLERGVERFPRDMSLARRLVEVLRLVDRGDKGQSLIDALGNLVDVSPLPEDRAELLGQMGRLFEDEQGNTSAAIEVLHEALSICPQHGPTLRALGRVYQRQNNWYGLADLYEKELAAPAPLPDAWRRHFQVAEIYEERLEQPGAALRHYRAALAVKPTFQPALQAVVRLYTDEGDWEELADLLVEVSDRLTSRRRQVHLLEQAVRICEDRLEDDLRLRRILERLAGLDPESPRAIAALTRLYKRTREWEKLIALHLREAGFVEDLEETATLFWQCGKVAEEHLNDTRRAEEYYRQALQTVPDFLPSLESLCRLLARDGRYEQIFEISRAELDAIEDLRVKARRMEAMSELLELRLDRRSAAIELVEAMHETCPDEPAPVRRLIGLYSEQAKWDLVAELLERLANMLDDRITASEAWCALGEVRERKLADEIGALDAFGECLSRVPDHPHALRGAMRCGGADERSLSRIMGQVDKSAKEATSRQLARRQLARVAEQSSGNPAAAIEIRQAALSESFNDREARDMLEAAFAWTRNMPGLAGLWAAAGRSVDEGLLGLLSASAGINAAGLVGAFLARWGKGLEVALLDEGNRGLWNTALGELSRSGLDVLADPNQLSADLWARMPDATRRRCALALLMEAGGPGLSRAALDRGATVDPASLRLRALLATGEQDAYAVATRAEIRGLAAPEVRVRRLLELSRAEGIDPRDCLEAAIREQCHATPVQEALYDRLKEAGHDDLLRMALEAHLAVEDLPPRRRSHLAFSLGQTLERLAADPDACFEAYRASFQASQDRTEALICMARLARQRADQWEAIRCLEAFMARSGDRELRIAAGLDLSDLYLGEVEPPEFAPDYDPYAGPVRYDGGHFGRKAIDLLTALREESRGTEQEALCLRRLAHGQAQIGSPFKAVELFQEILAAEFNAAQADEALALAELYSGPLSDLQSADQVLTILFESCPGREDVLERLLDVSRRQKTLDATCQLVERMARMAAPELLAAPRRRQLLQRAAQIYDAEVGRHRKAAAIWGELSDGAGEPGEERRLRVRQAQALSHVQGEERKCRELMLKLQLEDPFDRAPYEGLEILYKDTDDFTRLRVIQQVRLVLDADRASRTDGGERRKTHPSRPFSAEMLQTNLLPEGLRDGVLETLRALEPLAIKLWGDALPTLDALGGKRWRTSDYEQVRDFATLSCECFEMPRIKLYLGDSGPGAPQVFTHSGPSLWFHRGMFEEVGVEVSRYLCGYAAGLAWSGVASLVHLDGRDLWHLLEAVLVKQTSSGMTEITDPRSMELVEAVGGAFNRSLRRKIADAALPHLGVLRNAHCEAWPSMIRTLAVRSGLVLSGQISAAMQAILRSREWRGHLHDDDTQARLRKLPEAADLLRFSLSDDYLELRFGCGLDSQPRR